MVDLISDRRAYTFSHRVTQRSQPGLSRDPWMPNLMTKWVSRNWVLMSQIIPCIQECINIYCYVYNFAIDSQGHGDADLYSSLEFGIDTESVIADAHHYEFESSCKQKKHDNFVSKLYYKSLHWSCSLFFCSYTAKQIDRRWMTLIKREIWQDLDLAISVAGFSHVNKTSWWHAQGQKSIAMDFHDQVASSK